jgi:hypothetical protein
MRLTASKLRQDIYSILDSLLESGEPIEILRKGRIIRLVLDKPPSKVSRLKKHKYSDEDPDFFNHLDWSKEWKGGKK